MRPRKTSARLSPTATERTVPAWPATAGGVEAGQVGDGQLGDRLAEQLGGRHPAGAHDEGDVVGLDAGQLAQRVGGLAGEGVRVRGRVAHGRDPSRSADRSGRGSGGGELGATVAAVEDRPARDEEGEHVLDGAGHDPVDPAHDDAAGLGERDPAVLGAGLGAQQVQDGRPAAAVEALSTRLTSCDDGQARSAARTLSSTGRGSRMSHMSALSAPDVADWRNPHDSRL